MYRTIFLSMVLCPALLCFFGCGSGEKRIDAHDHESAPAVGESGHETHAGHEAPEAGHEEHGDAHEQAEEAAGHAEPSDGEVELSARAVEIAGIKIDVVKPGIISASVELAGEVGMNEDRVAHVVPRFPGIVRQVLKNLGDRVEEGEALASIESNESLSQYQIKSHLAGTVIEKHITLGEFASADHTLYVIADLSDVWVNLAVYEKDARNIRAGQSVRLEAVGGGLTAEGTISYVRPVYDERTRSFTARVVLPNPSDRWRPGTFVRARVHLARRDSVMVVAVDAVQTIKGKTCLFVPVADEANAFRRLEVEVGEGDGRFIRLVSGLLPGDAYVSRGAFELKAQLMMGSMSGHEGHGH